MRFLFKVLALLVGFGVVGLAGLSVLSILVALGAHGVASKTVVPTGVSVSSPGAFHAVVERAPEQARANLVRTEILRSTRPASSVSNQPELVAAGALAAGLMALPLLVLIGFFVLAALVLRFVANRVRGPDGPSSAQETRMMQEIYQGLTRFEQRIQSLETILLDSAGYQASAKR